jgi:hypothetical protein
MMKKGAFKKKMDISASFWRRASKKAVFAK